VARAQQKEDETGMDNLVALAPLIIILAIVAIGFFSALYLSVKYAKEADRAWPDVEAVEAVEAEATSAGHR
jgi:hypothetical protein